MDLIWCFNSVFFVKRGRIHKRTTRSFIPSMDSKEFEDLLKNQYGYKVVKPYDWYGFLSKNVGAPESSLYNEIRRRVKNRDKYKISEQELLRKWRENEAKYFDGMILGLDRSSFDITEKDFSFAISLRTCPFAEQTKFVRENAKAIKEYVISVARNSPKTKRYIGDLRYYYISEMIVTRDSQIRVVFSLRKEIESILGDQPKEA